MTGGGAVTFGDADVDAGAAFGGAIVGDKAAFVAEELHNIGACIDQRDPIGGAVLDAAAAERKNARASLLVGNHAR